MLDSQHVLFNVTADGQEDAIRKVVAVAANTGRIGDANAVVQAVLDREQEGTTGFGKGIAIPHGKSNAVKEPTLLFARLAHPVDWNSLDGAPVDTLFVILVPADAAAEHLKILSKLARKLMHEDFVQQIKTFASAEALVQYVNAELQ
ncbi:PTS mannose transporter subunit IIAB [Alicyclobacillus hesperidum]|uniref:PTS mannose transporter subunit IIAB n=1 Tax=Alicyclobacillus hesperidum TaxID=89784 RepID=A0A1H2SNE8_9BACL|nr:fructose PTS transporter subunit IIA [Alicyclobacillus hesperidum]GLV12460.1 PTS mannose transporter subunit IIAB [Alicyclobacillus hesperidum]GLV12468.1 PTS mannose transporter subunit IIAB [Alicyclobacillus hesperidum]SDW33047.1 PTS system IIA component, Fru family [Alicyclobacillus hesperidum]